LWGWESLLSPPVETFCLYLSIEFPSQVLVRGVLSAERRVIIFSPGQRQKFLLLCSPCSLILLISTNPQSL